MTWSRPFPTYWRLPILLYRTRVKLFVRHRLILFPLIQILFIFRNLKKVRWCKVRILELLPKNQRTWRWRSRMYCHARKGSDFYSFSQPGKIFFKFLTPGKNQFIALKRATTSTDWCCDVGKFFSLRERGKYQSSHVAEFRITDRNQLIIVWIVVIWLFL